MRNHIRSLVSIVALVGAVALFGCGGGGGSSTPKPSPVTLSVTNVGVAVPSDLDFHGGEVTISASVYAKYGVYSVDAIVTKPSGTTVALNLSNGVNGTYSGKYAAPANPLSGQAQTYSVVVIARDEKGSTVTSSSGSFAVPAAPGPPPPPTGS